MSIRIMAEVWSAGPNDKGELLVLLALADFSNNEGECWPAIATLAQKSRMTERGVQKILSRLTDTGWLEIEPGNGRKNTHLFRVKTPNTVHPQNPEPGSPPNAVHPEPECKNPEPCSENPEPGSPKPSRTVKEPSPLTPQGGDCGSGSQAVIAEIVEEVKPVIETGEEVTLIQPSLVVQNESISDTTKDLSLGSNISADENNSQFVPLVGKDPSTGRPYNPWIGQLVNAAGVVDSHCLEPGFLNYLIKFHSDTRYFKNKTGAELEIAIASWAQKMVPGRQQQVSQLWKKYKEQEDSPLSEMTLGEAKREYKRSQRNAKLNQWIRE